MPTETSSIITVHINNNDHSQPIRTSNSLNGNVVSNSIHHCSSKNKLIASSENMRNDIDRNAVTASNHNNSLPSENNLVESIGTKHYNCEEPDIVNNSSPGKFLEEQSNTVDIEVDNEGVCDGENSMKEDCDGENSTNDADNQTENRESKPRSTIRGSRLSSVTVTRISECSSTGRSLPRHSSKLKRREEHRLAMSLIVVVIVFVICWLPFCVSMLIMVFAKTHVPREFHMFTLLLGYANSGCNPIIYGLMNKRFAAGFKDLYCFWKKHFRMPVITTP